MIFLDIHQMFFTAYSLRSLKLFQFKTEEQTILTKKLTKKLQKLTSKFSLIPGFEQPGPVIGKYNL